MKHNFDELHAIIEDLQQAIEKKKQFRSNVLKSNPEFKPILDEVAVRMTFVPGCMEQQKFMKLMI